MTTSTSSPPDFRIERVQPGSPQVRDIARIQLAAFDPFEEYQSVIEPKPRPALNVRLDRLAFRINEKLAGGEESSHVAYIASEEGGAEGIVGAAYWLRPGKRHKLPDVSKMDERQREAWMGWETEKYSKLYAAFQAKTDEVLEARGESGCWYLEILAIQPEYQGKRLGPRLLDHHLALIDDATSELPSAPAWLESSPEAERLYRSRGFEDVGKVRAEGWGEGFPAMLRPRRGGE